MASETRRLERLTAARQVIDDELALVARQGAVHPIRPVLIAASAYLAGRCADEREGRRRTLGAADDDAAARQEAGE